MLQSTTLSTDINTTLGHEGPVFYILNMWGGKKRTSCNFFLIEQGSSSEVAKPLYFFGKNKQTNKAINYRSKQVGGKNHKFFQKKKKMICEKNIDQIYKHAL